MYVAKKTWFFWHAAVRRMPSDREHAFFQGGKSTSYEHVCLVTANSGSRLSSVGISRQHARFAIFAPKKGERVPNQASGPEFSNSNTLPVDPVWPKTRNE